ncbi:nuclear transport factor 2 family protein [Actinoplanes sp. HUAS TT8]|uniref:nuclear transport factor 2 family protein n=1 Tax=Actinoplanes sp. HUAS TT8 TaxID=3447453 RepID=UPI003F528DA2
MTDSQKSIFLRYVYAGAISRDPDAVAALFTPDGVYEAPLMPARWSGRAEIRAGVAAIQRDNPGEADPQRTGYVLHETADPDVFIAEIDSVVDGVPVALVQIFRVRDGLIARLRDYFRAGP